MLVSITALLPGATDSKVFASPTLPNNTKRWSSNSKRGASASLNAVRPVINWAFRLVRDDEYEDWRIATMSNLKTKLSLFVVLTLLASPTAFGQLTPSQDSYTNTADPTTNYGAQKLLDVDSSQTTYIQFGTMLGSGTLTNATALGANAEVDASNSLVLGSINGVNGQTATVKVGIGTTTPSNVFTIASGAGEAIADGWSTYSSRRWK